MPKALKSPINRPIWAHWSWISLVQGDEACISQSRKSFCLWQTPKNYAVHSWWSYSIQFRILAQPCGSSLYTEELRGSPYQSYTKLSLKYFWLKVGGRKTGNVVPKTTFSTLATTSVTRRPDCVFNIWPFSAMKICPKAYKLHQSELET